MAKYRFECKKRYRTCVRRYRGSGSVARKKRGHCLAKLNDCRRTAKAHAKKRRQIKKRGYA